MGHSNKSPPHASSACYLLVLFFAEVYTNAHLFFNKAKGHECWHSTWGKRPISSFCLAWLLSIVKKDSFESPDTGLFTSNSVDNTVKTFVRSPLLEPLKKQKHCRWVVEDMDSMISFYIKNWSEGRYSYHSYYSEVPCCTVCHQTYQLSATRHHGISVCHFVQAQWEKKGTEHWRICFNCVIVWVSQPKFLTSEINSTIWLSADDRLSLPPVHCT